MTRGELVAILADLVRRRSISLEDAREVLALFDAGELTDVPLSGTRQDEGDGWLLALLFLLALLGGSTRRPITRAQRLRARRLLKLRYQQRVTELAATVVAGLSIAEWQTAMQTETANYTRQMAVAGAGALPRSSVQAAVDAQLATEWPYLAAFAVTLLVGGAVGNMLSEAMIAARSILYGATGWGAYWRGAEPEEGYGQIVYYEARDDGGTCGPCSSADSNSPYLVGSHPRPGEICRGRGRCRCTLRFEYDESIYKQLSGIP